MLLKASSSGARVASSPARRLVCGAAVAPRSAVAGARRPLSVPDSKPGSSKQAPSSVLTPPAFGSIKRGMADSAAPPKASAAPAVAEPEVTAANNPLLSVSPSCMVAFRRAQGMLYRLGWLPCVCVCADSCSSCVLATAQITHNTFLVSTPACIQATAWVP
jgi:hypothetical protein